MLEAARAGATYDDVEAAGRAAVGPTRSWTASASWSTRSASRSCSATARGSIVLLDPLGRGEPAGRDGPGAIRAGDEAGSQPTTATATPIELDGHAARRARVDPRLVALPVRAGQPAAGVRPRRGARLPARPAGRGDRALGAGRDAGRSARPVRRRAARRTGDEPPLPEERLARYGPTTGDRVRLGRHRPVGPRRRGPPGARRRADLGLRQDDPAARSTQGRGRPVRARRGHRRRRSSSIPSSASSRRTSASRTAGSSGIGRAGNPAISDGIDLPSGRTPSRSWPTG